MQMWSNLKIAKNDVGVGIGNVVIAFMCIIYYCTIITWALYYLAVSVLSIFNGGRFPWDECQQWWNDPLTCVGSSNQTYNEQIEANINKYNLTAQPAVEQFWEYVIYLDFLLDVKER